MSDPDLRALLLERALRRAAQDSGEPIEVQLARCRAMLVAAFGEADVAAAEALGVEEEIAEGPV
jgi:hypothetical protein